MKLHQRVNSYTQEEPSMTFELPALPYDYSTLEPYIDTETMYLHHDKHHATYVNTLNAALKDLPQFASMAVEELVQHLDEIPASIRTTVRNNAGGHANHSMYWRIMTPNGGGEPTGDLASALRETFGSFENFQSVFNEVGAKRFGSGWVWLILDADRRLQVISTANQDSPLMNDNDQYPLYPIMGNDVWEHAYYLKYQNRRLDYLSAWWNVVNWDEVARRYDEAWK
jgi:Fe-Mn family superoxide dismutase